MTLKTVLFLLLLVPCLPLAAWGEAATSASLSASDNALPAAARPEIKTTKKERFLQLHDSYVKRAKQGPIDVLFLGDSITERWTSAPTVWKSYYGDRKAANFGVGGDRTQNVLWRILNGELEGISPKVVVVMIGTNNSHKDSPQDIAIGIERIVRTVREKLPESKVLLLGIFPRGPGKNKQVPLPRVVKEVNQIISKLHDGKGVHYLDIGDSLLVNGKISKEIMPDQLHLSKAGYEAWAKAMEPTLQKLLKSE